MKDGLTAISWRVNFLETGSNELLQLGLLQLADHQFNGAFFVNKIHALERFQYSKFWKKKIIGNSLILKFSKSLKFLEIKISLKI